MITRRKYIGAIAASLAASTVASASTPSQGMNLSRSRSYQSKSLTLHIEQPSQASDTGILLLPRIYGVEKSMVENSKEIASLGMTAVVWDPYQGNVAQPMNGATALKESRKLEDNAALSNIKSAIDYMSSELGIKKIGILGWCLGGRFALLAAASDSRVKSVTIYHPTIYPAEPTTINTRKVMPSKTPRGPAELTLHRATVTGQSIDEFAEAKKVMCPARLIRPGHDLMQPADYEKLTDILNERTAPTNVEYYPLASHGFSARQEFEENALAHQVSWATTLAFLKTATV